MLFTWKVLVFLFITIHSISSNIFSSRIYSISGDNSKSSISPSLITIINQLPTSSVVFHQVISNIQTKAWSTDLNISKTLIIDFNNGDFGSDILHFLLSSHNGQLLDDSIQNIEIQQTPDMISSLGNPQKSKDNSNSNENIISCRYTITNTNYTVFTLSNDIIFQASKIESTYRITFALINSKLFSIDYTSFSTVTITPIKEENSSVFNDNINGNIHTFTIINDHDLNNKYLVIIDHANIAYVFTINYSQNSFTIALDTVLNIANKSEIIQVTIYRTSSTEIRYYVAMKNKGIVYCDKSSSITYQPQLCSQVSNIGASGTFSDLFVVKNNWYALNKAKGWYVIRLDKNNDYKLFQHSKMSKIDWYINPFTGYKYIGVSFIGQGSNEEFFMELLIVNDSKIVWNKIFTSPNPDIIEYINMDSFNSFFYCTNTHSLYIIRRGILNDISFSTYQIKLNTDKYNEIKKWFLWFDYDKSKVLLGMLGNGSENPMYLLDNYEYPKHYLNCSFTKPGTYIIRFTQKADTCYNSWYSGKSFAYCQKIVDFVFYIYDAPPRTGFKVWVSVWFCSVLLFIFGIIMFIVKNTHYCEGNKLKIISIVDKDDKEIWYSNQNNYVFSRDFTVASHQKQLSEKGFDDRINNNNNNKNNVISERDRFNWDVDSVLSKDSSSKKQFSIVMNEKPDVKRWNKKK